MKAIQYRAYGGYEENRLVDLPTPSPSNGEVLLQMTTVGINPLDNTFRSGNHHAANSQNVPRVGGQSGVGVVVEARHLCVMMRGVEKQHSSAVTSHMLGSFRGSDKTREEFLALIRNGKNGNSF